MILSGLANLVMPIGEIKQQNTHAFSKSSLKRAVRHLIENCHYTVGNLVMRQCIGIPMGIDPAPFWANLYLYYYEEKYISGLIKSDKIKARKFRAVRRFIDGLLALNDGVNLAGIISTYTQ